MIFNLLLLCSVQNKDDHLLSYHSYANCLELLFNQQNNGNQKVVDTIMARNIFESNESTAMQWQLMTPDFQKRAIST